MTMDDFGWLVVTRTGKITRTMEGSTECPKCDLDAACLSACYPESDTSLVKSLLALDISIGHRYPGVQADPPAGNLKLQCIVAAKVPSNTATDDKPNVRFHRQTNDKPRTGLSDSLR
jgi:hypothetical protein